MRWRKLLRSTRKEPRQGPLVRARSYALITGASQGLGRALAVECARRGMDLVLVALPQSGLEGVAREVVHRFGVRALCYDTDLTAPGSVEALAQWVLEQGLPVTALINNAGVGYNRRFEDSTLGENEACILLNNLALVKLTRLLLPVLRAHPRAHVLNVASMAAFFPMPFMPVYAPSKAFVVSFSLALREELRHTPVQVSVLCPNGIRTNDSCRERIAAGGLAARLTCMDADQVARRAVRGMLAGRAQIVPGGLNGLLVAVGRLVPRTLVYAVVSAFWGRNIRPAAALRGPAQPAPLAEGGSDGPLHSRAGAL